MPVFPCHVCRTDLTADDAQAGQLVRCPKCMSTLQVPGAANDPAAALAAMHATPPPQPGAYQMPGGAYQPAMGNQYGGGFYAPEHRPAGRRYGFNCGHCSSRLEATEAMAAQEGTCPTCGNTITIPILDRYGRLIDPKTRQIIKQDPHPVHAYAAAGDRAPQIVKQPDGTRAIQCSRCGGLSSITSNNCRPCGMPFTMEGTTLEAAGGSNGFAVASLVLGIIGLLSFCLVIPPVLALIFGVVGWNQLNKSGASGGKGMAVAGIVLGTIGCLLALYWIAK
jgi:DNA-directed RNA polymerase subunit RPC12/RpoP